MSKYYILNKIEKMNVGDEFLKRLSKELDKLDSREMLDGEFDVSDINVAIDKTLSSVGRDTVEYMNSLGQSYSSQSELSKKLRNFVNKSF